MSTEPLRPSDAISVRDLADMQTAVVERILVDARRLQDDLVHRIVVATRQGVDRLLSDGIGRGADLRLDIDTRCIEPLGGDNDFFLRRTRGNVRGGG